MQMVICRSSSSLFLTLRGNGWWWVYGLSHQELAQTIQA